MSSPNEPKPLTPSPSCLEFIRESRGFIHFLSEQRAANKAARIPYPHGLGEFAKQNREAWNTLDSASKQLYIGKAVAPKATNKGSQGITRNKKTRDYPKFRPTIPTLAPGIQAFNLFLHLHSRTIRASGAPFPKGSGGYVSQTAQVWRTMDCVTKQSYFILAEELRNAQDQNSSRDRLPCKRPPVQASSWSRKRTKPAAN